MYKKLASYFDFGKFENIGTLIGTHSHAISVPIINKYQRFFFTEHGANWKTQSLQYREKSL